MKLSMVFILFMFYSFLGWCIEVIYTLCSEKTLVNRGFLIGPYCPIYGYGCLLIILLLKKYTNDPIALFIMSFLICSVLEYATSYFMEKLFNARWWNYSNKKFNINGRICLETLVPFGIMGCLLIYLINPFITNLILNIPPTAIKIITIILFIIYVLDNIVSFSIISKISVSARKMITDNTEEISKKVKEYISNNSKFGKRLMKSFPNSKLFSNLRKNKR